MTTNPIVLFCLVSEQAMANVLPILQLQPRRVLLFTTDEEKTTAHCIAGMIQKRNFECSIVPQLLPPYDALAVRDILNTHVKACGKDEEPVLNVTGGTKVMALGAYETFRQAERTIIYNDMDHDQLIVLYPPDAKLRTEKASLTVKEYLSAYGYSIDALKIHKFGNSYHRFVRILSGAVLDEFEVCCERVKRSFPEGSYLQHRPFSRNFKSFRLMKDINKGVTLTHLPTNTVVSLKNDQFLSGVWLEYLTYLKVRNCGTDDCKMSVNIRRTDSDPNEIDVLGVKKGRLILVSCKSTKYNKKDIFELEGLKNLAGGTFGKCYLVIGMFSPRGQIKRAQEMGITVVTTKELMNYQFN
jgi:hypothetical protein